MKKSTKNILKSLFTILAALSLAAGGTVSFFLDREESVGNVFTAGGIDLKVDSKAHYNGLVCHDGVWTDPDYVPCGVNQVFNWDFEEPLIAPGQWDIFPASSTGWQVEWMHPAPLSPAGRPEQAQLEYHNNIAGTAQSGAQYVELDSDWDGPDGTLNGEPSSVRIYQDIVTVSGKTYNLSFWFSRRPSNPDPSTNILRVVWGGIQVATGLTGDVNPSWVQYSYQVIATSALTRLAFEDIGTPDSYGSYLDNISLTVADCQEPAYPAGEPCVGTWEETNLEDSVHKFFDFNDLKPGDYGEDTVSLHLYGNDAWARLMVGDIVDSDNTCAEPELDPVDLDCLLECVEPGCAGGPGELRANLLFRVFLDQGAVPGFQNGDKVPGDPGYDEEEGDNVQQEAEPALIEPGAIDAAGETWNLWEGLAPVYAAFCQPEGYPADGDNQYGICHGLAADGRLVASATYYFGLAWELPLATGNEAQSDVFGADISFEVEQWRNNPDPFGN